MAEARSRARRGEGGKLRDDVLRAAEDLIVETGDAEAVTIRAVARRVGVSAPAVYLHFESKTELLDAVSLKVWAELQGALDAAAADEPEPFEALRRRGVAYVEFGLAHPVQYRLLLMDPRADAGEDAVDVRAAEQAVRCVETAVQRCIDAGVLRGDPRQLALTLWTVAHGLVSLLISKPGFAWPPVDEFVDATVRAAGLGIAALGRLPREP